MRSKLRVLIVEDHMALAENLFEFLGEQDYALDFASDGSTALHLLSTNEYDVIVLDVMLPGLSGFDLCQRIRTDLQCATPIIMMTAKDRIEDKAHAFSLGADDYLVKPFHLRELALRIHALHRRRQGVESVLRAGNVSFDPGTLQVQVGTSEPLQLSGTAA
nr:response regulator transcription factor [Pseudomonas sp.]